MPTLEITTMVGCPLRCTFCPQDELKSSYGKTATKYLLLDDFKTILAKVPRYVRIDFSGMAEPWANSEATDMLEHTLQSGYSTAIYTTLYGMSQTEAARVVTILRQYSWAVELVCLHLPDKLGNMRGFKPSTDYERSLAEFLVLRGTSKIPFQTMTMDQKGETHPWVAQFINRLGNWQGLDRAKSLDTAELDGQPVASVSHGSPVICSMTPFYDQNVLLPNGDVLLCCMDYGMKHRIGNLLEQDYHELFASAEIHRVQTMNHAFYHSDSICKDCTRATAYHLPPEARQFWQQK